MYKRVMYLLGLLVGITTIYHSVGLLPLIVFIPVGIISLGIRYGYENVKLGGLIALTVCSIYCIPSKSLADIVPVTIFLLSFLVPLLFYWGTVLSIVPFFDKRAGTFSISYFLVGLLVFYTLVIFLDVNEYLLSAGNESPQAIILTASAIIVFIPYNYLLSRKD